MAIKIKPIKELIKDTGLKILVYGPAGIGKTVLSTTTGERTLLISAEAGLLSLKKIIRADPKVANLIDGANVTNIADLLEFYEEIADAVQANQLPYKWIILDSISEIAEVLLAEEKANTPDARKAYGVLIDEISKLVRRFRDLPGVNIMMTCKQKRITDDFSGITSYVPMLPGNTLYQNIGYWFDVLFCMRILKDEEGMEYRALQTDRDIIYEAKDRSGMLGKFEKPDIAYIFNKIHPVTNMNELIDKLIDEPNDEPTDGE